MRRLVSLAVVALVAAAGCAALNRMGNAVGRGDLGGAVQAGQQLEAERARLEGESKKCAELEKKVVSYEEETQIGGAVALALAGKAGGVYIELSPELPAGPLQPAMWAKKKPKPGTGEKTALNAYLDELGKGLAAYSSRPDLDWTFVVLDNPGPNAFSAPGGYVFVTTGMLSKVENEAQLAAVLAHEIGHVTGKHALEQYKTSKSSACKWAFGLKLAASAASEVADRLVGEVNGLLGASTFDVDKASAELIEKLTDTFADKLTSAGMGPEAEFAADRTTVELLVFAGYDPGEYEKLVKALPEGGGMTPHPKNADRLAKLKEYREKELGAFSFEGKTPPLPDRVKVVRK